MRTSRLALVPFLLLSAGFSTTQAGKLQATTELPTPWNFAVAGDSRNCGDVIMPAIAAGVAEDHATFYWHLGDLRKISGRDQDFMQLAKLQGNSPSIDEYREQAWKDFQANQLARFGSIPFFLGIGNHETVPPRTKAEFLTVFADLLNAPEIKRQRLKDDPKDDHIKTYYHWVRDGIDFINLDNSTNSTFDEQQLKWFEDVVHRDSSDKSIHTLAVGMHEALPESISEGHSMNESEEGTRSGRQVYNDLLKLQNASHKKVYVLASHSHYFMDGIFNTEYWRRHGGILPGWIIGTAGAERYPLPRDSDHAKAAQTNVYGYLLATVNPAGESGNIKFEFREISQDQIPPDVVQRFTPSFVEDCFKDNRRTNDIF